MNINAIDQLLRWRRDVRHFDTRAVPETILERAVTAAEYAPSVGLSQPWRVIRLQDMVLRNAARDNFAHANALAAADQSRNRQSAYARLKLAGFDQAPEHFAVYCETSTTQGASLGRHTMPETLAYSCVCMIQHFWLALHAQGVGLGWVSILQPTQLSVALAAPESWQFIAYLLVGYPSAEHESPELERVNWQARTDPAARWLTR